MWMELGVFWMFLCIATDPTRSCCSLLTQRAKFESCDAVMQQQPCDVVLEGQAPKLRGREDLQGLWKSR